MLNSARLSPPSQRRGLAKVLAALAALWLLAPGCGDDGGDGNSDDGGAGAIDGGGGGGSADAAAPDANPPAAVRFIVMGDTGEGNTAQRDVAIQIRDKCANDGCDFVILLGDNFYDDGVESVTDPQWQSKFEVPYADIELPFYPVLGNHDYGGKLLTFDTPGMGNEWGKGPTEVQYTSSSTKWVMPSTYYTMKHGNVGFIMLDTNSIMWDDTTNGDQRAWYPSALAELSGVDWIFAVGHHPYRSNGNHGNAGDYESIEVGGVELPNPVSLLNGDDIKKFFDEVVCGTVDVTLAGHDHNRQWLNEPSRLCGAEMFVSGAGAKVKAFNTPTNEVHWADAATPGFFYMEILGNSLTVTAIDRNGTVEYQNTVTR